ASSKTSAGDRGVAAPPPAGASPASLRTGDAPDRAELERVRARDPEALESFFERYFDRVYGLVFRLLGDRTLAEDMTQEVFLKVHRAAHQLDPGRDPAPWIMTIAHNACRDLWRSNAWKLARRAAHPRRGPRTRRRAGAREAARGRRVPHAAQARLRERPDRRAAGAGAADRLAPASLLAPGAGAGHGRGSRGGDVRGQPRPGV